jgi:hypothetical protein
MERLADLLPQTVRQFGLEDQFEQAAAVSAASATALPR